MAENSKKEIFSRTFKYLFSILFYIQFSFISIHFQHDSIDCYHVRFQRYKKKRTSYCVRRPLLNNRSSFFFFLPLSKILIDFFIIYVCFTLPLYIFLVNFVYHESHKLSHTHYILHTPFDSNSNDNNNNKKKNNICNNKMSTFTYRRMWS